ncbi:hypothetical protein BDZ85DRAFT_262600 [Elsinoe ampelina]|uniref:Peptidase S54 rhomboid domain-containing protein n=1 Tax=Elsinoe ampelina TaxID=302913 RepID=A0A6A6GAX4_9PEZI|nr:hypothetical protein BDZ85DRAFT_262600 [Elsinoe ampelina]
MRHAVQRISRLLEISSRHKTSGFWIHGQRATCQSRNWEGRTLSSCSNAVKYHRAGGNISSRPLAEVSRRIQRTFATTRPVLAPNEGSEISIETRSTPSKPSSRQLTWRDYDPDGGLPLPSGDLSATELESVFSEHIEDADVGNWIIRLMNWRRQSGALIDKQIDFPPDLGVSRKQAYEALIYLRKTFPDFDEQSAGVAWAEEQINEVSAEYVARAEKLGIYRKDPSVEQEEEAALGSSDVYGESQLVEMRRSNEARAKAAEEERLAQEKADEEARLLNPEAHSQNGEASEARKPPGQNETDELGVGATGSATLARPRERAAWVRKYEEAALLTKETTPPPLTKVRRLLPSLLVTLGVLAFSLLLHETYVPSPNSARYFPDTPPALATIATLTSIMVAVFLAYRIPPLWRVMNKYFITSPGSPTAASVFLSTFTHQQFPHLFFNVALLWSFGRFRKFPLPLTPLPLSSLPSPPSAQPRT